MSDIKRMDIKEFRAKGYLQELNRRFLHPLGLALETIINDDDTESFGGVWDYREDKEGMLFGLSHSDVNRKEEFKNKKTFIDNEFTSREKDREEALGFIIEPVE